MTDGVPLWTRKPDRPPFPRSPGRHFDWIERSVGERHENVRRRIQRLWDLTPTSMQPELLARMKAETSDFLTAYAELWFMHHVNFEGMSVGEAGKTPAGSKPDFGIFTARETVAVAEVKLRFEDSFERHADEQEYQWFRQTFQLMTNKRVRVIVSDRSPVKAAPSAKRFAKWLDDTAAPFSSIESGEVPGEFEYSDPCGWALQLRLFLVDKPDPSAEAQLMMIGVRGMYPQGFGINEWLDKLDNQHASARSPVILCLGWNDFENEPDFEEVAAAVAKRTGFLERRRVLALCWSRSVTPYSDGDAPVLIHWGHQEVKRLVTAWRGAARLVSRT